MAEEHQARMQNVVEDMVQSLERDHIRKMQVFYLLVLPTGTFMYLNLVFSPLCPLQDRLTRCTMHCNDKAKDLFDSGAKEPAVRSMMERCVGSCVDDHVNLIPSMTRRIKENLDSIEQ
ncbi:protein FAM136A [Morone saxatilis]|uniref:protein FAM136A n=1 Tax=Morone saxatilis TaxID=34816 RepID=UPI0015E1DA38|nr:protein FAM136A [Morone saxatilis]